VELTFTGKLRGEPTDEVFIGRLGLTQNGDQLGIDGNGNPLPFMDLPSATFEKLSATPASGVYRSRGIDWDTTTPIHLVQVSVPGVPNAGVWSNILQDGYPDPNFTDPNGPWNPANYVAANDTHTVDRTTGIIAYDTRLGGKVYMDPAIGSIKFVGGSPSPAAVLRLSYQGRFLRVSDTGSAYSSPSGLFDHRVTTDPLDLNNGNGPASFVWRQADSNSPTLGDSWATNQVIFNDRYVFTYNKASAVGSSIAASPYMSTRRIGVPLTYPVYVAPNGVPGYVQVQWIVPPGVWGDPSPYHFYEVDPANGKIYFQDIDEGVPVKITYQAADPKSGALLSSNNSPGTPFVEFGSPAMIPETSENPILINQAVNEQGLDTFLDPFSYANQRRPPLMWLFWSSTRNGVPDIYFETLSPMLIPRPVGVNQ
jgi:hypothetical protein